MRISLRVTLEIHYILGMLERAEKGRNNVCSSRLRFEKRFKNTLATTVRFFFSKKDKIKDDDVQLFPWFQDVLHVSRVFKFL